MLATGISSEDAQRYLDELPPRSVVVACVNSPSSTTLSGDVDLIDQLEKKLQQDGHFARKLRIDTAYHSPHMEELVEVVGNAIACIKPEDRYNGTIPMLSSVTKKRVHSADVGGSYWVRNMVSSVEFTAAVTELANLSESSKTRRRPVPVKWTTLFEIGPHSVLKGPVTQILRKVNPSMTTLPYYTLVARNQNALRTSMDVAGSLWSTGHTIDLAAVNDCVDPTTPKMVIDLPSYPWNHQNSFWHEPLETAQLRQRKHPRHDILGAPLDYQNALEPRWRNFLRLSENPWMSDHVVAGTIVFPAAGMMVMAIEAARQLAHGQGKVKGIEFQDLHFMRGVVVPNEDRGLETLLQVSPHPGMAGWYEFGIFSLPSGGGWIQHAKGAFIPRLENPEHDEHAANWAATLARIKDTQSIAQKGDLEQAYSWLSQTGGLTVGPCFKTTADVFFCEAEPRIWLSGVVTDTKQGMPYERETPSFIHPTTLDCLFQSALLSCSESLSSTSANIPIGVDHAYISDCFQPQTGEEFIVHTETQWRDGKPQSQCIASDPSLSQPWITFDGVHLGRLPFNPNSPKQEENGSQSRFSSIVWEEHLESPIITSRLCPDGVKSSAVEVSELLLNDWVDRLCHTNGDGNALITASDTSSAWIQSLAKYGPKSGKRPCLRKVTAASCGVTKDQRATNDVLGAQITPIATIADLASAFPSEEAYDVIIIDELNLWNDNASQLLLPFLSSALDRGGFAALKVSESTVDLAAEALNGFDGLEIHSLTSDRTFIVARKKPASWTTDSEIYVLSNGEKSNSSSVFAHLEKVFATHNVRVVPIGLDQVSEHEGKTVISLLDLSGPWITSWTPKSLQQLQQLVRAQYVLWVSPFWAQGNVENAAHGATAGLLRTLRNEHFNTTMPQLLVDVDDLHDEFGLACGILQVMQLTMQESSRRADLEYRLTKSRLLVPRVLQTAGVDEAMHTLLKGPKPVPADLKHDPRPLDLKLQDGKEAYWEEKQGFKELQADHVELKVEMATVFDINGDPGKTPESALPMFEIVGRVNQVGSGVRDLTVGDKVLTLTSAESGLSTTLRVPESDTINMPALADPTQAISAPLAYLNAHQILTEVGRLGAGASVLLVGSISQTLRAMIDFALSMDMLVIVATDCQNTTDVLSSRYPSLKDRIFGIHSGLEASVSRLTKGCGVEATISFLGGYSGRVAAKCLVGGGQYINLSNEMKLSALPESFIDSGCTFSSPQLRRTFSEKPGSLHASVRKVMNFMKEQQLLHRVEAYQLFPISNIQQAFQRCKETNGRVIVDFQAPGQVPIILPLPEFTALPSEKTYILAGGLGTLGLALAETLVESGARHLVFLGRSGVGQKEQKITLDMLRGRGCSVDVLRCDISKAEDMENLSSEIANRDWNVAGVIQCTTVLKVINPKKKHSCNISVNSILLWQDAMFENMTFEEWSQSTDPKVRGTLRLHQLFSEPERLEFFVTLSSVSSVMGNMGQANYCAGNGFMDALMEWRRNHGLAGISINAGLVSDASGVSDIVKDQEERLRRYNNFRGTEILTHELQTLLRVIINSKLSLPHQIIAGMTDSLSRKNAPTSWLLDRKFDHRLSLATEEITSSTASTAALLKEVDSVETAAQIVLDALSEYLATAMATTADSIDADLPLSALGGTFHTTAFPPSQSAESY
jgi:NADPH:quinone reductase-like Zn-dependent oxidoreductase/NAD(P)-dependent dehydrogenase (short-subunit alcohol dehydrogenase family)